jgi:hypothetical protein
LFGGVEENPVRHLVLFAGVSGPDHVVQRHNSERLRPATICLEANEAMCVVNDGFHNAMFVMRERSQEVFADEQVELRVDGHCDSSFRFAGRRGGAADMDALDRASGARVASTSLLKLLINECGAARGEAMEVGI